MSEFKGIDKQIQKLQNSHLSDYGKELLTELQRLKKEHSEMLEMLKQAKENIELQDRLLRDAVKSGTGNLSARIEQLIKEVEL
jgi:molybdenum-dependent DNA-binding transcriptional regulator ModE